MHIKFSEFREFTSFEDRYDYIDLENITAAKLSISIRASTDAYIFLCDGRNYYYDFCYWIIIGWWKAKFIILKCATGVPIIGTVAKDLCETVEVLNKVQYVISSLQVIFSFIT